MLGLVVVLAVVITGLAFLFHAQREESGPGKKSPGKASAGEDSTLPMADVICSLKKDKDVISEKTFLKLKDAGPRQLSAVLEIWPQLATPVRDQLVDFWRQEGFLTYYIKGLGAKKEADRLTAVQVLSTIRDLEMIPSLVAALGEPRKYLPARVAEVLLSFDKDAVDPLVAALAHLPEGAVCLVIDILAELADQRAVPALARELTRTMRRDRTDSAGGNEARLAEEQMNEAQLDDQMNEVQLDDQMNEAQLDGQMNEVQLDEVKVDEVKRKAAAALGEIGSIEAEESLLFALGDEDWGVRSRAAKSLGQIGSRRAIPELRRALGDEAWWVRTNAREALKKLGEGEEQNV